KSREAKEVDPPGGIVVGQLALSTWGDPRPFKHDDEPRCRRPHRTEFNGQPRKELLCTRLSGIDLVAAGLALTPQHNKVRALTAAIKPLGYVPLRRRRSRGRFDLLSPSLTL